MDEAMIHAARLNALIRAAEEWDESYLNDPKSHGKLLKMEGQWKFAIRKWLKSFADTARDTTTIINWYEYGRQVRADYNVDVVISDDGLEPQKDEFIKVSLQVATDIVAGGANAGESIYKRPLGLTSTNAEISKLGTDMVARLVGRIVLPDGSIVRNENSAIDITESIRKDIAQSIKTSLSLGETTQEAGDRVAKVINNQKRATLIAQTESVNAYQAGLSAFAHNADMVGKEWQSALTDDICHTFSKEGPKPIDYKYGGEFDHPTAHPRCKCGIRYISLDEWVNGKYGPNPFVNALLSKTKASML